MLCLAANILPLTRSTGAELGRLPVKNVREMLRVNAQQIQPSFGPLIIKAQAKEIEAELASSSRCPLAPQFQSANPVI